MNFKKLSRVLDSENSYYFFDGFDGILEKNLSFEELLELVKNQLNPDGDVYKSLEEDPDSIWDIEWDLIGGDFEQIHYNKMSEFDKDSKYYNFFDEG